MKSLHLLQFILLTVVLPATLNGQRIASENVTVRFNRLPNNPLPADYTTYSASISSPQQDAQRAGLNTTELISKYFNLRSFKQLNKGGHFHINVEVGPLTISSVEDKEIEQTKEDKEGVKTTTKTYHRKITYRISSSMQLVDVAGNILMEKTESTPANGATYIFKDTNGNFSSLVALEKAWERKQRETENKLRHDEITKACKAYSELIYNRIDTRIVEERIDLQLPKGKKVANADDFATMTAQAVDILKGMTASEPVAPLSTQMKPVFDFWLAQAQAYDPTGKNTAKIHHACLYNLALVHFYLENFPVAREYIAACEALDVKKGLTSSLANRINSTTSSLLKQGITSLHFGFDLTDAQSPPQADYRYLYKNAPSPSPASRLNTAPGYLITSTGDSLSGNFVFSDGKQDKLRFYEGGNVTFVAQERGKTVTRLLDPNQFKRASFNGRQFISLGFSEAISLMKRSSIMEIMEEGPKINLYYYHPFHQEEEGNLVIQKGEDKPIDLSISNLKLVNWKNGFSNFFEDCPALKTDIEAGEYRRNEEHITLAVKRYNGGIGCE
jgi:hypothetical protein